MNLALLEFGREQETCMHVQKDRKKEREREVPTATMILNGELIASEREEETQ